ncbi:hypothetical protein [Nocardiopsis chromatogenes]|uniref:hypothetical protein n=1 Tax=Nocardiopsis chromatogenes TaxID=280239 RepID=UPI0003463FE3|nr:hypothetical protein [Nocardiopsis chromatogenes]
MPNDDLSRITGELGGLRERVSALEEVRDQVDRLADRILDGPDRPLPVPADGACVVSWFDLRPEQARQVLDDLSSWLRDVLSHYSGAAALLFPCWYRHPALVQDLLDLRSAWLLAYRAPTDGAAARDALDWSERRLPLFQERASSELSRCNGVRHSPETIAIPVPTREEADAYLHG